jgi:uncharacterized phage protein gp47/JayE
MRPNLREIYENLNTGSLLFSELDIFTKVTTGMTHMLYSYIDQKSNSLIPDTAKGEELKRWAKALNVSLQADEDDEELRYRVIDHLSRPPHGGCKWDFERWATIKGVSKAFVFPTYPTLGTVGIACLDEEFNIINEDTELSKQIIEQIEQKKPVTCKVQYVQLVPKNIKINIVCSMDTKRALKALSDYFKRHPSGNDVFEIRLSTIHRILLESGLKDYELIEPAKKIPLEKTEVPRLTEKA